MKRSLLIFVILLMTTMFVSAEGVDDQGKPNDPSLNPRANACYSEGSLEGKCDTDWEWQCGYYLIRWEADGGRAGDYVLPIDCESLLPPVIPTKVEVTLGVSPYPSAGCILLNNVFMYYVDFKGGYSLIVNSPIYTDSACTNVIVGGTTNIVYAPSGYDADALCQAAFGLPLFGPSSGPDLYVCL